MISIPAPWMVKIRGTPDVPGGTTHLMSCGVPVLIAHHVPQGLPGREQVVLGLGECSLEAVPVRFGAGQLVGKLLVGRGEFVDAGDEFGMAGLADLLSKSALNLRLEPVPHLSDVLQLSSGQLQIDGEARSTEVPVRRSRR